MSSHQQPGSKQPSPSIGLLDLAAPAVSPALGLKTGRQRGHSTTVGQSNEGVRDLGVLNVDTNEPKPANRFARRRKKALSQLSIHSLHSLAPLAPAPSRIPGAPPGQVRQDPLTQRPLPLHRSTQPHRLVHCRHPQRRSPRAGRCLLGSPPPPPPPRLSSKQPHSALCSLAGERLGCDSLYCLGD